MFLGRYLSFFFVGGVIVVFETYGLTGSMFTETGSGTQLAVLGPIPAGSVLASISFTMASDLSTPVFVLYFALSGSQSSGTDALEASSNLVAGGTRNTFRQFQGLWVRGGFFFSSLGPWAVGRKIIGGSKWFIFGAESGIPNHTIVMQVNAEIVTDSSGNRASRGGGTVLDSLRTSAADSL